MEMGFPRGDGDEKSEKTPVGIGSGTMNDSHGMISVGVGMSKNMWFKNSHLQSDLSCYVSRVT